MTANKTVTTPLNDNVLILRDSHLKLVNGNHIAAAALNQTIYWNDKMGRKFWKTDQDFADELHISIHKFRRIKAAYIKPLPFIKITLKGIPATTNYEIDFDMLNEILAAQGQTNPAPTPPDTLPDIPPPQVANNHSMRKGAQSNISTSAQSITENTPEITKKITTEINPVVVNLKIFEEKQQAVAKKSLSQLSQSQQVAVMAVLVIAVQTSTVKNKVGYLRSLVNAELNGTFTPAEPTAIPITAAQRLSKERQRELDEQLRHELALEAYTLNPSAIQRTQRTKDKRAGFGKLSIR